MSPHFFIIIPIYNVESYLSECLDSILAQTYPHFEAILINDGSIDSSLKIAQEYAEKDKRFTLVSQENQGQSVARNKGLEIAKEKWQNLDACQRDKSYLCFVDSDDYWEKDALETFTKIIEQNAESNINMILSDTLFRVYPDNTKKLREESLLKTKQYNDKVISLSTLLEIAKEHFCLICTGIFQANFLFASGVMFMPGIIREDDAFMTEIILKSKVLYINPKPFYNYRFNENSTTGLKTEQQISKSIFSYFKIIQYYEEMLKRIEPCYQNYMQLCIYHFMHRITHLLQSFGYSKELKDLGISKQDLLPFAHYLDRKRRFCLHFPRLYGFPKRLKKSLMNKR